MTEKEFDDLTDMSREQLLGHIIYLRKRISQLEDQVTNMGWKLNPDRMGGQYTKEEKDDMGWL